MALISFLLGLRSLEPHFLHFVTPFLFLVLHLRQIAVPAINRSASGNFPIIEHPISICLLAAIVFKLDAGGRTRTFEGTKPMAPKAIAFDRFATPACSGLILYPFYCISQCTQGPHHCPQAAFRISQSCRTCLSSLLSSSSAP